MANMAGMGAIVADDGVGFRVWAPHAEAVEVSGEFSGGSSVPLGSEDDGYWYGFVAGATAGQRYRFTIVHAGTRIDRIDPYAAEVTNSVGSGVIYDHSAFDWEGDDFTRRRWTSW